MKMWVQLIIYAALFLSSIASIAQGNSPAIQTTAFKPDLQKYVDRYSKYLEIDNTDTSIINSLYRISSKDELIQLTDASSPQLRIIAFSALLKHNDVPFFPILLSHLNDTAKVKYIYNDISSESRIGDLMILRSKRFLSKTQRDTLIERVLQKHLYLDHAYLMLESMDRHPHYYLMIRELACIPAEQCRRERSLFALAKFKKHEDVPFIYEELKINWGSCSNLRYRTIENTPDTLFWSLLQQDFTKIIQECGADIYFCRAVAAYQDKKALEMLTALFEKAKSCPSKYRSVYMEPLFLAISKHYSELYEPLMKKMLLLIDKSVPKKVNEPDLNAVSEW